MAEKEYLNYLSADQKTQIHAVVWKPEQGEVLAVLQILHGMQEYMDRYEEFAGYLTDRGFMVVGEDHLGHGASIVSKDNYGFFAEQEAAAILLQDVHTLRTMIQEKYSSLPYFMLGHSMGAYMLRSYLSEHGDHLRGAILSGCGMVPDSKSKTFMKLCGFLEKIFHAHHRSKLIQKLSFGGPYRQYDVTGKDPSRSWLTKDESIVRKYYSDERCTYRFTLNGYLTLLQFVYQDNQPENISKVPQKLPIFLVSGAQDPVGDMGKGVLAVYEQYEKAGLKDITWRLYENDRHEILNELDRQTVYEEIYSWMTVRFTT